jgi:hypothetical protein
VGGERIDELGEDARAEGVQLAWAIERDHADRAVTLREHVLVAHRSLPVRW